MSEVTFNSVAKEIGELVAEKNLAYGDSFAKCGGFLRLLFPTGIAPAQYGDALAMVRIFDKQMRIATRKDALGESPYKDIAGYGILGATADAVAKYPPAHPYLHKSELTREEARELADAVAPPSVCESCGRKGMCAHDTEKKLTCIYHLPGAQPAQHVADIPAPWPFTPPADEWAEKDLCRRCGIECHNAGENSRVSKCSDFIAASAPPSPLSLALPSITVPGDLEEVRKKYVEEYDEWCTATEDLARLIEAWDVVQVLQTLTERGGDEGSNFDPAVHYLQIRHKEEPEWVEAAKRGMVIKNAARAMYAPEVNSKIIMSAGREW